MSWWTAFVLTQAIEMPIYVRGTRTSTLGWGWRLAAAFGASALTHPIVWFVLPGLPLSYWSYFAIAESFAVLAEWAYLWSFGVPRPGRLALLANATSAGAGLCVHWLS